MFGQFNISAGDGILRAANETICIFTFKIKLTMNARELGDSYLTTRAYSNNYLLECG